MACQSPVQFRNLTLPHCSDPRSDACAGALVKAASAYGTGCLDLSVGASPELGMPPYRRYACPGAQGALAQLCGSGQAPGAAGAGASASTVRSDSAATTVLGATTAGFGLASVGLWKLAQWRKYQHWSEVDTSNKLRDDNTDLKQRLDEAVSKEDFEAMKGLATINDQYRMALDKMDRAQVCEQIPELCIENDLLFRRAPDGNHTEIHRAIQALRMDRQISLGLPTTVREDAEELERKVTEMKETLAGQDEAAVESALDHYRDGAAEEAQRLRDEAEAHIKKADSMRRPIDPVPYDSESFTRAEHDAIKAHHRYIRANSRSARAAQPHEGL